MVVERGHRVAAEKPGAALRGRRHSFVAGTDVHHPTDRSLPMDAARCMVRDVPRACGGPYKISHLYIGFRRCIGRTCGMDPYISIRGRPGGSPPPCGRVRQAATRWPAACAGAGTGATRAAGPGQRGAPFRSGHFRGGGGWSTALRRPRGPPRPGRISAARRPCRGPPAGGGPGSGPLRLRHHLLPALPGGLPRRAEAFLRTRFHLYLRPPALRRSPRDTVDGSRPGRFAMAASVRPPFPVAWIRHLPSRVGWRWLSGMTLSHGSHRDRRRYPADSQDAAPETRLPTINGVALQSGTGDMRTSPNQAESDGVIWISVGLTA